jgi:hypothetical protein
MNSDGNHQSNRQRRRLNRDGAEVQTVVWDGRDYQRLETGLREVYVAEVQGPEWVRSFRRWSLRIGCCTVDEPGEVSAFVNLGEGDRPSLGKGRQSRAYRLIVLALGGPPPRGQIDFKQILVGKHFLVRIDDCAFDSRNRQKSEGEIYSRIAEFVRLIGP